MLALAVSAVGALAPTHAEAAGTAAKPVPLPKMMSRDEIRACFRERDALERDREAHLAKEEAFRQEQAQLLAEARALGAEMRKVDKTDETAVNEFNARAKAHDERVLATNEKGDAFNAAVDVINGRQADLRDHCTTRPFRLFDEHVVMKEIGAKTSLSGAPVPPPAPRPAKTSAR
ncbi:hypothetical protein ACQ86G_10055 [Roseateles chitinivorans]|uniref:hypothetical protein n=1 Tax=Roseateles chitinivorans TaxID=2917965 RepID=UPI003D674871